MALPEIFAEEECVDPRGVPAHDHILVIVGKDLRLDEIAGAQQIGDGAGFAHGAKCALAKTFLIVDVGALQFFAGKCRKLVARAEPKVARHIDTIKTGKRAHPDIVKLREQKRIDEMPAIDIELRVIDCLLRDLKPRRP